jgi:hypothetical protein
MDCGSLLPLLSASLLVDAVTRRADALPLALSVFMRIPRCGAGISCLGTAIPATSAMHDTGLTKV